MAEPTFFIFAYGYIHRYIHAVFLRSLALVGTFAVPSSIGFTPAWDLSSPVDRRTEIDASFVLAKGFL